MEESYHNLQRKINYVNENQAKQSVIPAGKVHNCACEDQFCTWFWSAGQNKTYFLRKQNQNTQQCR